MNFVEDWKGERKSIYIAPFITHA